MPRPERSVEYQPPEAEIAELFFAITDDLANSTRADVDVEDENISGIRREYRRIVFTGAEASELLENDFAFDQVNVETQTNPTDDTDQQWVRVTLMASKDILDFHKSKDYMIYRMFFPGDPEHGGSYFFYNLSKRLQKLGRNDPIHASTEGMTVAAANISRFVEDQLNDITPDDVALMQRVSDKLASFRIG